LGSEISSVQDAEDVAGGGVSSTNALLPEDVTRLRRHRRKLETRICSRRQNCAGFRPLFSHRAMSARRSTALRRTLPLAKTFIVSSLL